MDAVHNRRLRFVFGIRLSVMIVCYDVCQNDSCDSLRLFGKTKSPRPSRYAYAYSLKTLEIVAKERGVPRVSLFLLNMNFRETKFAGRREKQLSANYHK